jgi:hypothetical protein
VHLPRLRVPLVFAAAAMLIVIGSAAAAWTVTGSGTGAAKAGSSAALVLTDASAFTTSALYPGASGDLVLRAHNPNAFPIRITAVSANGSVTSDHGAACDLATGVSLANQSGLALDVGAGATATLTVPAAVSMSAASADACQGAVFSVPVILTAVSNA